MNTLPTDRDPNLESQSKIWQELLGPLVRRSDLDEIVAYHPGLIYFTTASGTEACPSAQFLLDPESNKRILIPELAQAWQVIIALHVDQLGESRLQAISRLLQSRDYLEGKSWLDVLKDPHSSEEQKGVVRLAIVEDADHGAGWGGIDLLDPRSNLGN